MALLCVEPQRAQVGEVGSAGVAQRFRCTKGLDLDENYDDSEVVPFLRSNQDQVFQQNRECRHEVDGRARAARTGCTPAGREEDGGLLQGSQLLRLEDSQMMADDGCAASQRARRSADSEVARLCHRPTLSLLLSGVVNSLIGLICAIMAG